MARVSFVFVSARGGPGANLARLLFSASRSVAHLSCYCHLGKLKAREELFYTRPIRMFHSETKAFLSFQLKSLLVPSSPALLSRKNHPSRDLPKVLYKSWRRRRYGPNSPSTSASASALISSLFINPGEQQQWSPTHSPPPPTTTLSHPTRLPSHEDTAFATTVVPWKPPRSLGSDYVEDA